MSHRNLSLTNSSSSVCLSASLEAFPRPQLWLCWVLFYILWPSDRSSVVWRSLFTRGASLIGRWEIFLLHPPDQIWLINNDKYNKCLFFLQNPDIWHLSVFYHLLHNESSETSENETLWNTVQTKSKPKLLISLSLTTCLGTSKASCSTFLLSDSAAFTWTNVQRVKVAELQTH